MSKYSMIATWKMSYEGVKQASELLKKGKDSEEAILCAIHSVEENPAFHSVGYSGLPNIEGVVQCDAGYMDGKSLQVGAVGALENVIHAVDVARLCSKGRFNNVLVGEGANEFAYKNGYGVENLLTEKSFEMYQQRKKENKELSSYDGHDTVGMVVRDRYGHMISATSTSGLFMKHKGRIGDSPLVGSGFYCDEEVGGASATGVGEEIMRGCLSYECVSRMKNGILPQVAAQSVVKEWDEKMKRKKGYCDAISLICMNADGEVGVGTNVKFAYVVSNENHDAQIFIAQPQNDELCIRLYDENIDEID